MLRGELYGLTLTDLWRRRATVELVCWKHGELNLPRDVLKAGMERLGRYFPVANLLSQGFCEGCGHPGTVSIRDVRVRRDMIRQPVLGDYRRGERIEAICNVPSCRDSAFLDVPALIAKYGPDMSMDRVRAMLRCKGCGTKGKAMTILRLPEPTDTAARALAMMQLSERRRIKQPPKKSRREGKNE